MPEMPSSSRRKEREYRLLLVLGLVLVGYLALRFIGALESGAVGAYTWRGFTILVMGNVEMFFSKLISPLGIFALACVCIASIRLRKLNQAQAVGVQTWPRTLFLTIKLLDWQGVTYAVATVFIVAIAATVYSAADDLGWRSHQQVQWVLAGEVNWIPGEYRQCTADASETNSMGELYCPAVGDGEPGTGRYLPVRFWGRTLRPGIYHRQMSDKTFDWKWRCQRRQESITCWAVN